jgi:hypothetical protein
VPLDLSLNAEQSAYADVLFAQADRAKGFVGRNAKEALADMDAIIAAAESKPAE